MTQLRRRYKGGVIEVGAVSRGVKLFRKLTDPADTRSTFRVERANELWDLSTVGDFVTEYSKGATGALIQCKAAHALFRLRLDGATGELTVRMASLNAVQSVVAAVEGPGSAVRSHTIFLGHGRAPEWHVLDTHLRDQHQIDVVSYETLAQLGEPATVVLERAALTASAAILIHSAEIQSFDGRWYPSMNVVHETGFFSARLGLNRAIVVREDRCLSITNFAGLTHLRYSENNIRETFGDLVSAVRRLRDETDLPNSTLG